MQRAIWAFLVIAFMAMASHVGAQIGLGMSPGEFAVRKFAGGGSGVPGFVPQVNGQKASLFCDFVNGNYYYSGAVQSSCPLTVSRTGNETCVNGTAQFTTAGSNVGCITGAGFGSTLQSYTNLALQSSTFQTTPWAYNAIGDTSFATTITAPDGTNTARKLTEDGTNNFHLLNQSVTKSAASITYSLCVYWQPSETSSLVLGLEGAGSAAGTFASFVGSQFGLGTPFGSGWTTISASNTAAPNGFRLLQLVASSDTTTTVQPNIILNDSGGTSFNLSYQGTPGNGAFIWGAQLVVGTLCPPLIQTTTAAVTTNPDAVTLGVPASTLLASSNASIQVTTQGVANGVASTIVDAAGVVLLGENSSSQCFTGEGTTLASSATANWLGQVTCGLSWVSGTSGAINLQTFATTDTGVTRTPAATFHLGSTAGTSAFLNGNVQSLAIYSPSVTFPVYTPKQYEIAAAGNDNSSCLTSAPCQSIAKANTISFNPGDSLLLNGGDTFPGCLFITQANSPSTNAANPLTIGVTGTGTPTLSTNCDGATGSYPGGSTGYVAGIVLDAVTGVVINGLNIVQNSSGQPTPACILIVNTAGIIASGSYTIENNSCSGGFTSQGDGISGLTGADILIRGFQGSGCAAINNVMIRNNTFFGASGVASADQNGIFGSDGCSAALGGNLNNYTTQGNLIFNLGGTNPNTGTNPGNGILLVDGSNDLEQFNIAHDNAWNCVVSPGCGVAFWFDIVDLGTIQFNEAYQIQPGFSTTGTDFDCADQDEGTTHSVTQYMFCHHNFGYGYTGVIEPLGSNTTWGPNTIRYGITENDNLRTGDLTAGLISFFNANSGATPGTLDIYNMTIWSNQTTSPIRTAGYANQSGWPNGLFANNIIAMTKDSNGDFTPVSCAGFNAGNSSTITQTFNHNDYFAINGGTTQFDLCSSSSTTQTFAQWAAAIAGTETGTIQTAPGLAGTPPDPNGTWNPLTINPIPSSWPPSGLAGDVALATGAQNAKSAGANLAVSGAPGGLPTRDFFGIMVPGTGPCFNIGAYGGCP